MILRNKIVQDAGYNWEVLPSTFPNGNELTVLHRLPSGRLIIGCNSNITETSAIWYSDDNGATCTQSNMPKGECSCICVTSNGRILAGMKQMDLTGIDYAGGVWYSDDSGVTWTQSNLVHYCEALCITLTGRIIAGTSNVSISSYGGIWYSDDNGEHWVKSDTTYDITYLECSALCVTSSGRILTGINVHNQYIDYSPIWYSDDNGITWARLTVLEGLRCSIIYKVPSGRIFTSIFNRIDNIDVTITYYSDDNGTTWTQSIQKGFSSFCVTTTGRLVGSNDAIDNRYIYYSDDNGITWTTAQIPERFEPTALCSTYINTALGIITKVIAGGIDHNAEAYSLMSSVPVISDVVTTKYLDKASTQELITQAKAYVDSLV